ncbi:Protein of unknown function [Gryllus bimaculatus]|nr:Protein of unknown function [Gryllus bimaculatus]
MIHKLCKLNSGKLKKRLQGDENIYYFCCNITQNVFIHIVPKIIPTYMIIYLFLIFLYQCASSTVCPVEL